MKEGTYLMEVLEERIGINVWVKVLEARKFRYKHT